MEEEQTSGTTPPYTYECKQCGHRENADRQPMECQKCGGWMQSINKPRE